MPAAAALAPVPRSRPEWCAIVGAPRCGTTSLARYLSAHPDICFSNIKEPHFFSRRDLTQASPEELSVTKREYLERFFPARPDAAVLAEASVSYLYAPERLLPVLKLWPDAKFIVAVRNPMEMLPSLHLRNLCNGDESERSFARAWDLVEERRNGEYIPRSCIDQRVLDYKEIGRLGKHVQRFIDILGRDRCFVSVFDDVSQNPQDIYREIIEFLGLPDDRRANFPVHRASAVVKIGWLQRLLKRPPKMVQFLLASQADLCREGLVVDPSLLAGPIKSIRNRLLEWNCSASPPAQLSPSLYRAMCNCFREDIAQLSRTIARDLSHWLAPAI